MISIHAPRTGSDRAICRLRCRQAISIHAPRTGSDGISRARRCAILPFQSTLPARGATSPVRSQCSDTLFQSTLPARGATFRRFRRVLPLGFQSTLPARGATGSCIELFDAREISIHAPRTGSDDAHRLHRLLDGISIHAPRTGSDQPSCRPRRSWHSISIHAPRTGSDPPFDYNRINAYISIHAPRTGSDSAPAFAPDAAEYFNPRSPHGERPEDDIEDSRLWVFQSTLPARGATRLLTFWTTSGQISIHAPRTGSDAELAFVAQLGKISIHAPRTGSDLALDIDDDVDFISIHAPRTGSDIVVRLLLRHRRLFQSTLPARGATKLVAVFARDREDFNPRSPHGERRLARATRKRDNIISIHAPRTGSDEALFAIARAITRISIHAPRTGSDLLSAGLPGLI